MKKINELMVSTPQDMAGGLLRKSRDVFDYTTAGKQREASLLTPIRAESYGAGVMPGPFTMNRPDGYLRSRIEERFVRLANARLRYWRAKTFIVSSVSACGGIQAERTAGSLRQAIAPGYPPLAPARQSRPGRARYTADSRPT